MKTKNYRAYEALALMLLAGTAAKVSAAETGAYLGFGVGESKFDIDTSLLNHSQTQVDDSDSGWSWEVGYRFAKYVAVEAGYIDFGSVTYSYVESTSFGGGQIDLDGFKLAAVGTLPLKQFEINAKLGAFRAVSAISTYQVVPSNPGRRYFESHRSTNSIEILYGVGAGYTFAEHFHFRADVVLVQGAGTEYQDTQTDVFIWTVGAQYRF